MTIVDINRSRSRFAYCHNCKRRHWVDGVVGDTGKCVGCWRVTLRGPSIYEAGRHINVCERCGARDWAYEERPLCATCTQVPVRWRESGLRQCTSCKGLFRRMRRGHVRCVDCINVRSRWMTEARALGTHTTAEWLELFTGHGGMCAYCGVAPATSKDHIRPVSKGGSNAIDNIAPACSPCNSSKSDRTLSQWIRTLAG